MQGLFLDLRHCVPERHVQNADGHRSFAVPTRFLSGHHDIPRTVGIEV